MTALPILLPDGFAPLIKENDSVTIGQPIAQKFIKDEEIINIPKQLSISLSQAKKVVKKNPGERVKKGEVIALKKGFLGMQQEAVISRVEGIVTRYERDTGNLAIRTSRESLTEDIISPVDGIVSMCDNKKIVINTEKNVITGEKSAGTSGEGEVFILEESLSETNGEENTNLLYFLDSRAIGKIVVGGNLTRDVLVKGIGIGAIGIIGTNIADEDIAHILEKKMETPVIQIEVGKIEPLRLWSGKKAYLDAESKSIVLLHS